MSANGTGPLERLLRQKLVAVVRADRSDHLLGAARALLAGGVPIIEITMTVHGALDIIAELREDLGTKMLIGAGTVLDAQTARSAIVAGAEFLVAPTFDREMLAVSRRYGTLAIPGAYTPTEILAAWESGADIVKVFPADIGGPEYLKALRGPLPRVRLMPTGGVNLDTARAFLDAGACCLGVGGALVEPDALGRGDLARITDLARRYVDIVRQFQQSDASSA